MAGRAAAAGNQAGQLEAAAPWTVSAIRVFGRARRSRSPAVPAAARLDLRHQAPLHHRVEAVAAQSRVKASPAADLEEATADARPSRDSFNSELPTPNSKFSSSR